MAQVIAARAGALVALTDNRKRIMVLTLLTFLAMC